MAIYFVCLFILCGGDFAKDFVITLFYFFNYFFYNFLWPKRIHKADSHTLGHVLESFHLASDHVECLCV